MVGMSTSGIAWMRKSIVTRYFLMPSSFMNQRLFLSAYCAAV
jgi:hypothetical protein